MVFLGFLIVVGLYVFCILYAGAPLIVFVDLWSLGVVVFGVTFHISVFGPFQFLKGLKTFFLLPQPGAADPAVGKYYRQLTGFTLGLGTVAMFLGLLVSIGPYRNPDIIGIALAFGLLAFVYATGIALTVFWPISLRHLPDSVDVRKFPIGFTAAGFASYFITRAFMITLLVSIIILSPRANDTVEPLRMEHVLLIVQQTFFAINPADTGEMGDFYYFTPSFYFDLPSLLFILGCVGGFRVAAGRIHNRWTWTPVCILYGVWGVILGMTIMLGNMDPKTYSLGCAVCLLSAFYGILGAIFFAIGSWRTPVLLILGMCIAGCLSAIWNAPEPVTVRIALPGMVIFVSGIVIMACILFIFSALFLYILRGGIKEIRAKRAEMPLAEPLTPDEKQAQQILDKAVEEERMGK